MRLFLVTTAEGALLKEVHREGLRLLHGRALLSTRMSLACHICFGRWQEPHGPRERVPIILGSWILRRKCAIEVLLK